MEHNKISLPIAIMIETLRHNGVSNQELIKKVAAKDISEWESFNTNFDFHMLISQFENSDFTSIIHDGYQIKFITINGLQNLLHFKFNLLKDLDYKLTENGISDLTLDPQQFAILKQMLSPNCIICENSVDAEGRTTIQIEMA